MTHSETAHASHGSGKGAHGRPYLMFWINMILGLIVMYVVMFSMIDGPRDFRNNLNMVYMAVTMWAPMGVFMLATMPGMYPDKRANLALYALFIALTAGSFWATRSQAVRRVDDSPPFGRDPDVSRSRFVGPGARGALPRHHRGAAHGDRTDGADRPAPALTDPALFQVTRGPASAGPPLCSVSV